MGNETEGSKGTSEDEEAPDDFDNEESNSEESEENGEHGWNNRDISSTLHNRTKSSRLQKNCPLCAPALQVTIETLSIMEHMTAYLKYRFETQSAANDSDHSSLGESAQKGYPLWSAGLPNLQKSTDTNDTRECSTSSITKESIDFNRKLGTDSSFVELIKGFGGHANATHLEYLVKKYSKGSTKLTTKLFRSILGDNLKKMSLACNREHEQIPDFVHEAIKDYVIDHKKRRYNDEQLSTDVMKMSSDIRTGLKKAEGTMVEIKSIAKKLLKKQGQKQSTLRGERQQNNSFSAIEENKSISDFHMRTLPGEINDPHSNHVNNQVLPSKIAQIPEAPNRMIKPCGCTNDTASHDPVPSPGKDESIESINVEPELEMPLSIIDEKGKKSQSSESPQTDANIEEKDFGDKEETSTRSSQNGNYQIYRSSSRSDSAHLEADRMESRSNRKHRKHRSKGRKGKDRIMREHKGHHHREERHLDRKRKRRSGSRKEEERKRIR